MAALNIFNPPGITQPKGCTAIPAKAGIQENTGFRVKPGMTNLRELKINH
jgi:hypothetical protein